MELRDGIEEAHGNRGNVAFTLASDFNSSSYSAAIAIGGGQNISVVGHGAVVDAVCKGNFFVVYSAALSLDSITLRNGCGFTGGAVAITSTDGWCRVSNSVLSHNTVQGTPHDAAPAVGGAISNLGTLLVENTSFISNVAVCNLESESGGAIHNEGATWIANSAFTANSAAHGGAVSNTGNVSINASTFNANSVDFLGGAIYNDQMGQLVVDRAKFRTNTASSMGNGGAIHNMGNATLLGSEFENNFAGGDGGAIKCLSGCLLYAVDPFFKGNRVTHRGPDIYTAPGGLAVFTCRRSTANMSDCCTLPPLCSRTVPVPSNEALQY